MEAAHGNSWLMTIGGEGGGSWVDTADTGKKQRKNSSYFIEKVDGRKHKSSGKRRGEHKERK